MSLNDIGWIVRAPTVKVYATKWGKEILSILRMAFWSFVIKLVFQAKANLVTVASSRSTFFGNRRRVGEFVRREGTASNNDAFVVDKAIYLETLETVA